MAEASEPANADSRSDENAREPKVDSTPSASVLRRQLESQYTEIFSKHSIDNFIVELDQIPESAKYHEVPERITNLWDTLEKDYGAEGVDAFNRVALLAMISRFEERAEQSEYPASIVAQFERNFRRIEKKIATTKIGTYAHTNDKFLKDFAICREKLIPMSGAQVIVKSGIPRSLLKSGGIGQFFRYLYMVMFVTGGRRPFYWTHTHLAYVREFKPEGRYAALREAAELLERHPEAKGWCAGSWLYDPALERVSPELAYLRQIPEDAGAWVFRIGVDIDGGALSKSPKRRELYEAGEYVPTAHIVIWPRKKVIEWAKHH